MSKGTLAEGQTEILVKYAEDQPWIDHITQGQVLQTRRAVAEQDQLFYVALRVSRFLSYLSVLCDTF